MVNKKVVDPAFGVGAILVLVIVSFFVGNLYSKNDGHLDISYDQGVLIRQKNIKIQRLSAEIALTKREVQNLQQALNSTRNDLDVINKKLVNSITASNVPVVIPESAQPALDSVSK